MLYGNKYCNGRLIIWSDLRKIQNTLVWCKTKDIEWSQSFREFSHQLANLYFSSLCQTYFSAEDTCVLRVLGDFHFLNHFSKWGTVTSTILSYDSDLLSSLCLERRAKTSRRYYKTLKTIYIANKDNNSAFMGSYLLLSMAFHLWNNPRIFTHHFAQRIGFAVKRRKRTIRAFSL